MFFHSLLSSLWYFSFDHLPFLKEVSDKKLSNKSVSIYINIFIAFHILACDFASYMQSSIPLF